MDASEVRLRVAALVETGGVDGEVTVGEVAASPRSIGQALKRLGFVMSRRKNKSRPRKDGTRIQYPARWRRPARKQRHRTVVEALEAVGVVSWVCLSRQRIVPAHSLAAPVVQVSGFDPRPPVTARIASLIG